MAPVHTYIQKLLVLIYIRRGDLRKAVNYLEEMLHKKDLAEFSKNVLFTDAYYYYARICYEWNCFDKVENSLSEVLKCCAYPALGQQLWMGKVLLSKVRLAQGFLQESQDLLQESLKIVHENLPPTIIRRMEAYHVWNCLMIGDLSYGIEWLESLKGQYNSGNLTDRGLEEKVAIRVNLAWGHLSDAQGLLSSLIKEAEKNECHGDLVELLALQALIFQAGGEQKKALQALKRALQLAKPGGYIRTFVDEGPKMALLLVRLGKQGVLKAEIEKILRAFPPSEVSEPVKGASGTYAVSDMDENVLVSNPVSRREAEILDLINRGYSNEEISQALSLSLGTVKTHLHHIFEKLYVKNRHQACAKARLLGIVR